MNTLKANHIHVTTGKGNRQLFRFEQLTDDNGNRCGKKSVPIGSETYTWRADIDLTSLEHMAHQAARNKSGKSVDGALVVTITHRGAIID